MKPIFLILGLALSLNTLAKNLPAMEREQFEVLPAQLQLPVEYYRPDAKSLEVHEVESSNSYKQDLETLKDIPKDVLRFVKAPTKWTKREWLLAVGVGVMTVAIHTQDENIRDFVAKYHNPAIEAMSNAGAQMPAVILGGTAMTYLTGMILKDPDLRRAAILLAAALATDSLINGAVKVVAGRSRPYMNEGSEAFHGFEFTDDKNSFFSGHTSTAFTAAAFISGTTHSKVTKFIAYSAATLTGLSRIYLDKHWSTDVFVGAVFGYLTGTFFAKIYKGNRYLVMPTMSLGKEKSYGVSLLVRF